MASNPSAGTKQRRGKKDSNDDDASSPAAIDEQLARALATVEQSERQTNALHRQWRTYLLRLSYLLIVISMHQMQEPTGACVRDVKAFNAIADEEQKISGYQAFWLVVMDALPYILAIVMAAALAFFLVMEEPGNFSHPRYLLANACLPPMVGIHFMRKNKLSCLEDEQLVEFEPQPRSRTLPVVVIFHVIVTLCCWFIDWQRNQQARNVQMVHDLYRDVDQARKKGGATKGGASSSGGPKSKKKN
eukprot:scaffold31792_cov168-Amphora_coffeaeformis.AAC.11